MIWIVLSFPFIFFYYLKIPTNKQFRSVIDHDTDQGLDRISHRKNHDPDDVIEVDSEGSDDDEIADCNVVNDKEV